MNDEESNAIGRRRDSRLRLEIPARLITLDGKLRAKLCDLSQSGARLRLESPLKCGDDGVLTWLEYEAFGSIVWVEDGFAGMEFDELIDENVLLTTRELMDRGAIQSEDQVNYQKAKAWFTGGR